MEFDSFKTCIDCVNKRMFPNLERGAYYCPLVKNILPNGIVYYDTDATECIKRGLFKEQLGEKLHYER